MVRSVLFGILVALMVLASGAAALVGQEKIGGPDPATVEWPEWPHQVSCGVPFDPVSAFSGPTKAERGSSPAEKALRRFLARNILSWVPKHNWRLVAEAHGFAEFAAGRLRNGPEWTTFRRIRGRWKWQSYSGGCLPKS